MLVTENINLNDTVAEVFNLGPIAQPASGQILPAYALGNGNSLGNIDLHWERGATNPVTLAPSGSILLVLSALADGIGRPVAFARVKKRMIWVTARADGDSVTVGGAPTNAWTPWPSHTVSDLELIVSNSTSGDAVTAGVSDQVLITNNSAVNPVTFQVAFSGCSAWPAPARVTRAMVASQPRQQIGRFEVIN